MLATMKSVFLVLASLCLMAQASPWDRLPRQDSDQTFVTRQKSVYELFWHVDQPTVYHPDLYKLATTVSIDEVLDNVNDKQAVTEFVSMLKHGMLPRGQVFTMMDPAVRHQTVVLFRIMHSAKDFDTFYRIATWARFHMNEDMYVYALSVAVLHRPDTMYMKIPPMYEVRPHLFFNEEVMQKAYNIAMGDTTGVRKTSSGVNYHVVPANYSGWYWTMQNMPEQKLTYFTEDVGLNTFYFMMQHHYPFFMHAPLTKLLPQLRGEYYFYFHKQLLARYYLERLTNNQGEISDVSLDKPMPVGYHPTMHFRNGLSLPQREVGAVVPLRMLKYVQLIKDYHTRIATAIDLGYVVDSKGNHINIYTKEGLNILGNIVQGNADSVNEKLYGHLDPLVRKVFGLGYDSNVKYQYVPSALELFSTSMRDPMFYSIYKNILSYYNRYKENLPMYTTEELSFPGVSIESVSVDKLTTYFDNFESMLSNGVSVRSHDEAKNTMIKARQYRLNHKPFGYHITVNSDKNVKAVMRVFMGPKYDENGHELDLEQNYMNFVQMDEWIVDLTSGSNTIDRSSHESTFVVPDEIPSDTFYKKLMTAMDGSETFKHTTKPYGFPERLVLPRGRREGLPLRLFVVVSPFNEAEATHFDSPVWGKFVVDGRAMGYPLDRPVNTSHFLVSNMHTKDVIVYHKEVDELNATA